MANYREQLALARLKQKVVVKISQIIVERMVRAIEHKESWVWPFVFILAAFNDGLDVFGIGAIPFLGSFIDLFCGIILTLLFWNIGERWLKWKIRIAIWLATALEAILGLAILPQFIPFWLICAWYARHQVNKKAEIAERGLKQLKTGKINKESVTEFS